MKPTSMMMKSILLVASLFTLALPEVTQAKNINIVSDTSWTVTDANENLLGNAQNVCLSSTAPSNCPVGATSYGYTLGGWNADLSSIPGATWIWAPNITGATSPAANTEFTFEKLFYLCGNPQDGTIFIAADNSAEVFLNGATVPVLTSADHATISSATIPASKFATGLNSIKVKVKNANNPAGCASGQYQCNPAGVVVGASFSDALNPWPICNSGGRAFEVGDFEQLSCGPGQTGTKARACVCVLGSGVWAPFDSCKSPPPTCNGNNGSIFSVGATEPLSCPPGLTGSASRTCQTNGSWGPTNSSTCLPPPTTCTGNNGSIFSAGATEPLSCPPGLTGSASRICQSDGSWAPTSSTCALPPANLGDVCGDRNQGTVRTCPSGTTCGSRALPASPRPWWCPAFSVLVPFPFNLLFPPDACTPKALQTTDWFCD